MHNKSDNIEDNLTNFIDEISSFSFIFNIWIISKNRPAVVCKHILRTRFFNNDTQSQAYPDGNSQCSSLNFP